MGFSQEASAGRSIVSVRFFAEPPSGLTEFAFETAGLPAEFIGNADRDLDLGGTLVSYVAARDGEPQIEHIARLDDSPSQGAFYSRRTQQGDWEVYHASYPSGVRYSCLVEFLPSEAHGGDVDRASGDSSSSDPSVRSGDSTPSPLEREFAEPGSHEQVLFCSPLGSRVDIVTAEGLVPVCAETQKSGKCDDRYCLWSLAVALGLNARTRGSEEEAWIQRDTVFWSGANFWIVDWCETAWDSTDAVRPVGSIFASLTVADAVSERAETVGRAIEEAARLSILDKRLRFFEITSLEFPPDGREPFETPEIASWAKRCLHSCPDMLFWLGPTSLFWFLGCVRPQYVVQGADGPALKLNAADITEVSLIGRDAVMDRLRTQHATDVLISRLLLSSNHKLAWALCKGQPPIKWMPGAGPPISKPNKSKWRFWE